MTEDVKERIRIPGIHGNQFSDEDDTYECKICPKNELNISIAGCNDTFVNAVGPYCYYRGYYRVIELRPCHTCCWVGPNVTYTFNSTNNVTTRVHTKFVQPY